MNRYTNYATRPMGARAARPARPMTPKQEAFLGRLLDERDATATSAQVQELIRDAENLTSRTASTVIDALLAAPRKPRAPRAGGAGSPWAEVHRALADVPTGRYAISDPTDATATAFYRLSEYRGRRFFARVVGGGDGFHKVQVPVAQLLAAATAVASDARGAAKRFSEETNTCSRCAASLSDPVSVILGFGTAVCVPTLVRQGFLSQAEVDAAKEAARFARS